MCLSALPDCLRACPALTGADEEAHVAVLERLVVVLAVVAAARVQHRARVGVLLPRLPRGARSEVEVGCVGADGRTDGGEGQKRIERE